MTPCPHCSRPILKSAVRCRHCRRLVRPVLRKKPILPDLHPRFAQEPVPGYGCIEVCLFFAAFLFGAWWIHRQDVSFEWVEWLRQNFFIFTREPLLQIYVYIFTETFILKLGFVLLILVYLFARGQPVALSLGLTSRVQSYSKYFLFGFFALCVVVAWWEGIDPLTPDLPTPLFFQESALLGNILAVVSLAVVAPITEEIIFRGFMYPAFCPRLGPWGSVVVTTVFFTAAHAPQMHGAYENLWIIFVVGALLSWQRAVTGSTMYTIGLHALYNVSLTTGGFIRFCFYGF